MAAGRIYTPEEKLKIVLEGMSGTISIADLCRKECMVYDHLRERVWRDLDSIEFMTWNLSKTIFLPASGTCSMVDDMNGSHMYGIDSTSDPLLQGRT